MPHKVLCRHIGLSWDHGKEVVRQLKTAGFLTVIGNASHVTDVGLAKLAEVNRQLLPYVQTAIDNPYRLRNLISCCATSCGLGSRSAAPLATAARLGRRTSRKSRIGLNPNNPIPPIGNPACVCVSAAAPQTEPTPPLAQRFRSLGTSSCAAARHLLTNPDHRRPGAARRTRHEGLQASAMVRSRRTSKRRSSIARTTKGRAGLSCTVAGRGALPALTPQQALSRCEDDGLRESDAGGKIGICRRADSLDGIARVAEVELHRVVAVADIDDTAGKIRPHEG